MQNWVSIRAAGSSEQVLRCVQETGRPRWVPEELTPTEVKLDRRQSSKVRIRLKI
jgi:hypothetical protein